MSADQGPRPTNLGNTRVATESSLHGMPTVSDENRQSGQPYIRQPGDVPIPYDVYKIQLPLIAPNYEPIPSGNWPKRVDGTTGAYQYSWAGGIAFPFDTCLTVDDIEKDTYIDKSAPSAAQIAEVVISIKSKASACIADDGVVTRRIEDGRMIEEFKVRGFTVCKVIFADCSVHAADYKNCSTSRQIEKDIIANTDAQPSLEVEQWVATYILLLRGVNIGCRAQDFVYRARTYARGQLYLLLELEKTVQHQIDEFKDQMEKRTHPDIAFAEALQLVKEEFGEDGSEAVNPYFQEIQNDYALDKGAFQKIKADIVMVLDSVGEVIAFQFTHAFSKLLGPEVQKAVEKNCDHFSTKQPPPRPDSTRHGLHETKWLPTHPEFQFRIKDSDPRTAKSGVYHFGVYHFGVYHFGVNCEIGDHNATEGIIPTRDMHTRFPKNRVHVYNEQQKLYRSVLGPCSELSGFFFSLLDPELFESYKSVASETGKTGSGCKTRKDTENLTMFALISIP